ncbi:hypothetical protein KPH14_013131, partial [Odynerus spinipes]
ILVRYRLKAERRRNKIRRLLDDYGDKYFDFVDYDIRPNDLARGCSKLDITDPRFVRVSPTDLKSKFSINTTFENIKKILDGLAAKYQCQSTQSTLNSAEQSDSYFVIYVRDFFDLLRHFDDELMADWYEILYKIHRLYSMKKISTLRSYETLPV